MTVSLRRSRRGEASSRSSGEVTYSPLLGSLPVTGSRDMTDPDGHEEVVVVCDFCGGEFTWSRDLGDWAECPDCSELTPIVDDEDMGG